MVLQGCNAVQRRFLSLLFSENFTEILKIIFLVIVTSSIFHRNIVDEHNTLKQDNYSLK